MYGRFGCAPWWVQKPLIFDQDLLGQQGSTFKNHVHISRPEAWPYLLMNVQMCMLSVCIRLWHCVHSSCYILVGVMIHYWAYIGENKFATHPHVMMSYSEKNNAPNCIIETTVHFAFLLKRWLQNRSQSGCKDDADISFIRLILWSPDERLIKLSFHCLRPKFK